MFAASVLLLAQVAAGIPAIEGTPSSLAALRYIDVKVGDGAVAGPGKKYTVHYTGWLANGKKFDSSVDRKEPFEFVQGRRLVIAGWEAGFEGMKVGGKRRLFIPYQFAYGEKGRDPIPSKADLVFDVDLLGVTDVPEVLPAEDLLLSFRDLEWKVTALAKIVPVDKYGWRPAPGVRSFGEVFNHIAYDNKLILEAATGALTGDALKQRVAANAKHEKEPLTREQLLQLLAEGFAAIRKEIEEARAGTLARDVQFFGRSTSQRAALLNLEVHLAEHTGQLIAYARMNGIVPPWSAPAGQ
ncbi:MAG TPA: DinB family protein [Bryobacteraceae bacterium]|nr:DinB family protein [Bryobacteraceae bacterium]